MHTHRRSVIGAAFPLLLGLVTLAAALLIALPSTASAAPHHNHGLTIASTPDPITSGQGVLIYGQLKGPDSANQPIYLYHRINPAQRFTLIGIRHTDSYGFFEFVRADGVVTTNRSWFVRGPDGSHSRTIHEWVSSVVQLSSPTSSATTAQTVSFSGSVAPLHPHQTVLLQEQDSTAPSGNGWKTIASSQTDGSSNFTIEHRFRIAGSYTLRAYFPADPRNIAGISPSIALNVQQEQNPSFTIAASAQEITDGQQETISGTLFEPGSTTAPQPNVTVTLYGRTGTGDFRALQSTTTAAGTGDYSFTTVPSYNTVYYVSAAPKERTARLYVGVQDVVNAQLSSSTTTVGGTVKVTGTVTPDHTGHIVYLEQQNAAGGWLIVGAGYLGSGSSFTLGYTPGIAGTVNLRVQITGGPWSIGGVSSTLPLTVSGTAPVSSLPPAS